MNILVTGASGLIGSELCNQLNDLNHKVTGIDNMSRGTNIPKCLHFINQDLTKKISINPNKIDIIYHFAAINGTKNFYERPNEVIENNIQVDLNVFKFAKKCKNLKKIIYASSSEIMSHQNFCLESNDVNIRDISNPRWSYKISKMVGENYLHNSNLPWIILRYFNVYGPETKSGHVVYDQISNHKNEIYEVIGPEETRCYTHVKDAISATIICMSKAKTKEVINIGSQEELSSLEVAKIIGKHFNYYADYKLISGRIGSTKKRIPDISKLIEYYPEYNPITFEDGVKKILK